MQIKVGGESTVMVYFFDEISESNIATINNAVKLLRQKLSPYIIDIVASYTSVMINFDVIKISWQDFSDQVEQVIEGGALETLESDNDSIIEIPIFYGVKVGLDLQDLADEKGLSVDEVIQIHSAKTYRAFATGFAVGFAYLGILDERLVSPRLATPRVKIPANSLGIADNQTGIYPIDSPGGWKIIGKTPLKLFDKEKTNPNLINIGDQVKFKPISENEYIKLGGILLVN